MPSSCLSLLSNWSTSRHSQAPLSSQALNHHLIKASVKYPIAQTRSPNYYQARKGTFLNTSNYTGNTSSFLSQGTKVGYFCSLDLGFLFFFKSQGWTQGLTPARQVLYHQATSLAVTFNNFSPASRKARYAFLHYLKRRRVRKVHKVYMTTMNYTFRRY